MKPRTDRGDRLIYCRDNVVITEVIPVGNLKLMGFVLTYLLLGLTGSGQTGMGPYERLVGEADVIALGEILSTDETRMAADGPMYVEVRIVKVVKGEMSPAIRFGASAWVGPTYREGELRILFLQRIPSRHAYYQDAVWAGLEAGKLDLFFTVGTVDDCSEQSLLSFLKSLEEVASAPPKLQLKAAQRKGSSLTLSIKLLNDPGKGIWLDPAKLGSSFEANRVRQSLAVLWQDFDGSGWVQLPAGSVLSGKRLSRAVTWKGLARSG